MADDNHRDKPSCLIVFAGEAATHFIKSVLSDHGFRDIATADDAVRGLEMLELRTIDAVVVEQALPIVRGGDFVRFLRRRRSQRMAVDIAIVIITERNDAASFAAARDAGADEWLAQPFEPAEFIRCLNDAVYRRRPMIYSEAFNGPDRRRADLRDAPRGKATPVPNRHRPLSHLPHMTVIAACNRCC